MTKRGTPNVLFIIFFVIGFSAVLLALSVGVSRLFSFDKTQTSAFHLSNCFLNASNYGVPFCLLAFGQEGMNIALIYVVGSSIMLYTLAIYIASRSRHGVAEAAKNIFKMPLIYAFLLAIAVNRFSIPIPDIITKPVDMLGTAAIPVNILLLGIQLEKTKISASVTILSSNLIKLCCAPLLAYGLTLALGIDGLLRNVLVVESAMPTAVNSLIIAVEYDANPDFVSAAVLSSTLLSIVTLSILVMILG
jgi:predicted permease